MILALEQRFQQTPEGHIWTASGFKNSFWNRYLEIFDSIRILARTESVEQVDLDSEIVGTDQIQVIPLPYYQGPLGYLMNIRKLRSRIRKEVGPDDSVIVRLPGPIGSAVLDVAGVIDGRPWGGEIIGDPYDVFAPGAVRHSLRSVFRWHFTRTLAAQTSKASALAYVSTGTLQDRYPAGQLAFATNYSSIALNEDAFAELGRTPDSFSQPIECTLVGSLEQMYKGVDVLLRSIRRVRERGLDVRLTVIGDGRHRAELEKLADDLGVGDIVTFSGFIADRDLLTNRLDSTDLFILPSRTEGLPRAMIEAMARAVPCIGTSIGGIPELLQADEMVQPGDDVSLCRIDDRGRFQSGSHGGNVCSKFG